MMKNKGFNVYELLIVIILFLIIAAIFVPALKYYRARDFTEDAVESIEPLQQAVEKYAFQHNMFPRKSDLLLVLNKIKKTQGVQAVDVLNRGEIEITFSQEKLGEDSGVILVIAPTINIEGDEVIWKCDMSRTNINRQFFPAVCLQEYEE